MTIYEKFLAFVQQNHLFQEGEKVVLGVSGGADSIALMHLMLRLSQKDIPLEIAIACLDHGLRAESPEEVAFVQGLAKNIGLPFFTKRLRLAEEGDSGVEERAREERYLFLLKSAQAFDASQVAVAHHADDQAETVLLHFLKGTGIQGLAGMPLKRRLVQHSPILLTRPLLCLKKAEILQYLQEENLSWKEDSSNQDIRFTRNRIRHHILPFLQKEGYTHLPQALLTMSQHAQAMAHFCEAEAEKFFQTWVSDCCPKKPELTDFFILTQRKNVAKTIASKALFSLSPALLPFLFKRILFSLEASITLRSHHYGQILDLIQQRRGSILLPQGFSLQKTPSLLCLISPLEEILSREHLDVPGLLPLGQNALLTAQSEKAPAFDPPGQKSSLLSVALSAKKISLPLRVGHPQPGDILTPLGAPGERKISRILSDIQLPSSLREHILLVTDSKGQPLWIPGICIAENAKVDSNTQQILRLRLCPQGRDLSSKNS